MIKSTVNHRSTMKAVLFLAAFPILPLFAQETAQLPPTAAPPQQEMQPGAETSTTTTSSPTPEALRVQAASSPANDAARYLAGLPVAPGSPLTPLAQDPRWLAHAKAMNQAFSQLDQRQLNNIRTFQAENIAPATQQSHTCVYLFSGPDFLYADAMFPNCTTFILKGLEPVVPIPDLATLPPAALFGTLESIQTSLNTILSFSFFKTKDMREEFERSQLKGVLPAIFVFMARTGKDIKEIQYLSLDKEGNVLQGFQGATRGAKITFTDLASKSEKVMYYFTSDLSDDAAKRNPGLLRFCQTQGPANSLLKAASYLLHEGGFETVRNFLLQNSTAILQDDSGIPVRYFTADRWTLRFFGVYAAPIDLFKKFYQSDLRQDYAASSPKPLTFGFGYRWSSRSSTLFLAVRK
jgi:hypothetical protein